MAVQCLLPRPVPLSKHTRSPTHSPSHFYLASPLEVAPAELAAPSHGNVWHLIPDGDADGDAGAHVTLKVAGALPGAHVLAYVSVICCGEKGVR